MLRLLEVAGLLLQRQPSDLAIAGGPVTDRSDAPLISLADLARTCHFKPHISPPDWDTGLIAIGRHTPSPDAMAFLCRFRRHRIRGSSDG